jgi:hypothetical protein
VVKVLCKNGNTLVEASRPVKVGAWCAESARRVVARVFFFTKKLIAKDIYVQRYVVFNTSVNKGKNFPSFQMLSAC